MGYEWSKSQRTQKKGMFSSLDLCIDSSVFSGDIFLKQKANFKEWVTAVWVSGQTTVVWCAIMSCGVWLDLLSLQRLSNSNDKPLGSGRGGLQIHCLLLPTLPTRQVKSPLMSLLCGIHSHLWHQTAHTMSSWKNAKIVKADVWNREEELYWSLTLIEWRQWSVGYIQAPSAGQNVNVRHIVITQ